MVKRACVCVQFAVQKFTGTVLADNALKPQTIYSLFDQLCCVTADRDSPT